MVEIKVKALLNFLENSESQRKRIFYDGYIPMFKIRNDMLSSGKVLFINLKNVVEGQNNILAIIIFPLGHLIENYIKEDIIFNFYEGKNLIGYCQFIEIIEKNEYIV